MCALPIKVLYPPIDIQHTEYPSWFPRDTNLVPAVCSNYEMEKLHRYIACQKRTGHEKAGHTFTNQTHECMYFEVWMHQQYVQRSTWEKREVITHTGWNLISSPRSQNILQDLFRLPEYGLKKNTSIFRVLLFFSFFKVNNSWFSSDYVICIFLSDNLQHEELQR